MSQYLIIGIIVLLVLIATGIGVYFLFFRAKTPETPEDVNKNGPTNGFYGPYVGSDWTGDDPAYGNNNKTVCQPIEGNSTKRSLEEAENICKTKIWNYGGPDFKCNAFIYGEYEGDKNYTMYYQCYPEALKYAKPITNPVQDPKVNAKLSAYSMFPVST